MIVISRKAAAAAGLDRYFTGVPCIRGHVGERRVKSCKCLICEAEAAAAWQRNNSAKRRPYYRAYFKALRAADPEVLRNRLRRWRVKNREALREKDRLYKLEYGKKHPEVRRAAEARRRARKVSSGGSHTKHDIVDLMRRQRCKCANCRASIKDAYEVDHIMPLALGGDNSRHNIQLLCVPCNRSKKAKHPLDWARQEGRLL